MLALRGGHQTQDPRLDRVPSRDPRSNNYPIRSLPLADQPIIGKTWPLRARLDQGREGACVGFSWMHELNAKPVAVGAHITTDANAQLLYRRAQTVDEWPGEDYDGTSVLAGARVLRDLGYMRSYRWAWSVGDVLRGIAYEGPGVAGTEWLDGMFDPRPSGLLEVTGSPVGGHAWCIRGVVLKPRLKGETGVGPCVLMTNSWGRSWGLEGSAYVRVEDFERLLGNNGEFCLPVDRMDARLRAPFTQQ